jgi:hypothetical protein
MPSTSTLAREDHPAGKDLSTRILERRRNVLLAQHYRERGESIAQIARRLERAPSTIKGYLHDPSGAKAKARKADYAGRCERCGASTSGADGKGRAARHCQRCKPQSRPRWTREAVRGAHRFWRERYGFVASSVDWSGTHARRRGGAALERYQSARWPSGPVVRRLYGSPAAARAEAFAENESRGLRGPSGSAQGDRIAHRDGTSQQASRQAAAARPPMESVGHRMGES